jgi:hypothetical protein
MIICCSVLYGLLRRLRMSRALELDATLAARDPPLIANIMGEGGVIQPYACRLVRASESENNKDN